jgi:tetratricopeptide (TPR) repeat protein
MRERLYEEERQYTWIVYAAAMLLVGGLAGYMLSATASRPAPAVPAAPPPAAPLAPAAMVDDNQLKAYRDIFARDPQNVEAAVAAGNLLYDAKRYGEAIPLYQQALALKSDVNVSTDLGTALWYSGRADEALAQYEKSLAIEPNHAQTLFNIGIVKSDGKHDREGAIAAWQLLLAGHPEYPGAENVRSLIAQARDR